MASSTSPHGYSNPLPEISLQPLDRDIRSISPPSSSSVASPLNAPLLRSRSRSSSSSLLTPQQQQWPWIAAMSAAFLLTLGILALCSHRILSLPFLHSLQPQASSQAAPHTHSWLLQLLDRLSPPASVQSSKDLAVWSLELTVQTMLTTIQLLQALLAWTTRWVIEPLSFVLLLDVLVLTSVGLAYQVLGKLSGKAVQAASASSWAQAVRRHALPGGGGFVSAAEGEDTCGLSEEAWPKVLVQLPMYNEREVYSRAVASACQMTWPRSRLIIQVLDDSTEEEISAGMRQVVQEWRGKGVDVRYRHRTDRKGYKAGNLREGLMEQYALDCKYVAVLDADFEPRADWLLQAVPYLEKDRSLALVQTRWTFSNEDECLLTQLQAVELTWHFWAEQLVSSLALKCFGFNGTAGVWRTSAILDAGNWRDDTTVEDMDMAVCAAMRGWRMLMVPEVECLSEVPSSFTAYRKQQHRWTAGPASLLRQRFWSIAGTPGQALGWGCKVYLVGVYMVLRRSVRHLVGVALWVLLSTWLLLPALCSLVQSLSPPLHLSSAMGSCSLLASSSTEAGFPFPWVSVAFALAYPACLFCFSAAKLHLLPAYVLFMNGMLPCRFYAFVAGLFDLKSSHTWDVTQKLGKKKSSVGGAGGESEEGSNIVVSVEKVGADMDRNMASARLMKRPTSSTSSSSSSTARGGVPSGSVGQAAVKKQQQPQFPQEILMGWCLILIGALAASWAVAAQARHQGDLQLGRSLHGELLQGLVIAWMLLQGLWGLWIGGSRWMAL